MFASTVPTLKEPKWKNMNLQIWPRNLEVNCAAYMRDFKIQATWSIVVQSLSSAQLFATPGTAAHQVSLSFTISRNLLEKFMSIESVMLSNHLILDLAWLQIPFFLFNW